MQRVHHAVTHLTQHFANAIAIFTLLICERTVTAGPRVIPQPHADLH